VVDSLVFIYGSPSVYFARSHDTAGGIWWTTDRLLLLVVEDHMSLSVDIQRVAVNPRDEEVIEEVRHSVACCTRHGDVGRDWLLHILRIYKIHSSHDVVDAFNPDH